MLERPFNGNGFRKDTSGGLTFEQMRAHEQRMRDIALVRVNRYGPLENMRSAKILGRPIKKGLLR